MEVGCNPVALGEKKKNNNLPVQCHWLHPYHALENKRKNWLLLGGDPCVAAAKKEQSTC